jgi:AraC-like DNA-binding protein
VGYREFSPPAALDELIECAWVVDGPPEPVRVLPDGCMDLIRMDGRIMVAGPDTTASVSVVARDVGWSSRTLQRQCAAVYGYGPAMLRRILRFRRAIRLLDDGLPNVEVASRAGYADQPHLHREVRELAGVPLSQVSSGANRSTQLPSGSATVA